MIKGLLIYGADSMKFLNIYMVLIIGPARVGSLSGRELWYSARSFLGATGVFSGATAVSLGATGVFLGLE